MNRTLKDELQYTISVSFQHRVIFTENVFALDNPTLADQLHFRRASQRSRAIVFLDQGLYQSDPSIIRSIEDYFAEWSERIHLVTTPHIIPGGEAAKLDRANFYKMIRTIYDAKLCRHSYVVSIGGGAVLDASGFAASIVHRGLRQIRIPTTVLAQNDAGIGIKNGIDAFNTKNFLGTFHPPHAIINDHSLLLTLDDCNWRNGTAEAIKVGLIRDAEFFEWIEEFAVRISKRDALAMQKLVRKSAEIHLEHIARGGDPFEKGSARPLDFGHWSAHKLEQLSEFNLGHGEAVAIGMAVDCLYSNQIGLLGAQDLERILNCLNRLGFRLFHTALEQRDLNGKLKILEGIEEFREHLGGTINITLLRGIGQPVDTHELDLNEIERTITNLRRYA